MAVFERCLIRRVARDLKRGVQLEIVCDKYALTGKALIDLLVLARRQGLVSDKKLAGVLVYRREFNFPRNPEARLAAVLGCMNGELKQALLLTADSCPRTYIEFYKNLSSIARVELPSAQTFRSYCVDTLVPSGFLIQEQYGWGRSCGSHHFRLTQVGIKYGQPLAAFSIKYSVDHNISLYELLGQTQSVGNSIAPYNRVRILELVSMGDDRIIDLTDALGLSIEDVRQHLARLSKLGMLTYDSLNFEKKGMKLYRWVEGRFPDEAKTVKQMRRLTHDVAVWLHACRAGERNQIAEALRYPHVTQISHVLTGLVKQGIVQTPFISQEKSMVALLERSQLILDYARAVRNALCDGPSLREMSNLDKEFSRDRTVLACYVDVGIELYRRVSSWINAKPFAIRESQLLEFIKAFQQHTGEGARPVDVVKSLGWTHGTVTRALRSLVHKGQAAKDRIGPASRYSVLS